MYFQPIILVVNKTKIKESLSNYLDSNKLSVKAENIVVFSTEKNSIGIKDIAKLNKEIGNINDSLRIFLVEESNKLTEEAQNSLLKTLEEPNLNSLIILATDNPDSLRETIRSRCIEQYCSKRESGINEIYEKFVNSTYIERKVIIDQISKEEYAREFALDLNLYIMDYAMGSRPELSDKLMQIYRSIRQGCNLKLSLENLSILLI